MNSHPLCCVYVHARACVCCMHPKMPPIPNSVLDEVQTPLEHGPPFCQECCRVTEAEALLADTSRILKQILPVFARHSASQSLPWALLEETEPERLLPHGGQSTY